MQGKVPLAKPECLFYSQLIHLPQAATARRERQREMLKFSPIHTLKSGKLSVSSASSESSSIWAHHQMQNLILLPAVCIPPQVAPPRRFHVDPSSPPPSKHKPDY